MTSKSDGQMKDELPTFEDCSLAIDKGISSSIEEFIWAYEPVSDDYHFRKLLATALRQARIEERKRVLDLVEKPLISQKKMFMHKDNCGCNICEALQTIHRLKEEI